MGFISLFLVRQTCCMPWLLAILIDFRRLASEIEMWEGLIFTMAWDQLDELFGEVLLGKITTREQLQDEDLLLHILAWAHDVWSTVGPAEFTHGRNRTRVSDAMSWLRFAPIAYNHETKLRLQWQQKALRMIGKVGKQRRVLSTGASVISQGSLGVSKPKQLRSASIRDVVREEIIENRSALGNRSLVTSPDFIEHLAREVTEIKKRPCPTTRLCCPSRRGDR